MSAELAGEPRAHDSSAAGPARARARELATHDLPTHESRVTRQNLRSRQIAASAPTRRIRSCQLTRRPVTRSPARALDPPIECHELIAHDLPEHQDRASNSISTTGRRRRQQESALYAFGAPLARAVLTAAVRVKFANFHK